MRRMSWLATATAAALFVAGVSAQGKPDFSGKWTLVAPEGAAAAGGGAPGGGPGGGRGRGGGGGGGFCGAECTITQDATTLTVTRTTGAGEQKMVYRLDGSESKNSQAGRGGQATEIVSKAMFEGNALSITTQRPGRDGGPGVTQKTTLTLNNGQMEVDNAVDGGAGGPGGGRGGGGKQVYKKN